MIWLKVVVARRILNYSESGSLLMRWVITLKTCESKFWKSDWQNLSFLFVFNHSSFNKKLYPWSQYCRNVCFSLQPYLWFSIRNRTGEIYPKNYYEIKNWKQNSREQEGLHYYNASQSIFVGFKCRISTDFVCEDWSWWMDTTFSNTDNWKNTIWQWVLIVLHVLDWITYFSNNSLTSKNDKFLLTVPPMNQMKRS